MQAAEDSSKATRSGGMGFLKHHGQLLLFGALLIVGPTTMLAQAIHKAHISVKKIAGPVEELTSRVDIGGVSGFDIVAALIVAGLCWALGAVIIRFPVGQTALEWVRAKFVRRGPLYKKRQARQDKQKSEPESISRPVLARIGGVWLPGVTTDSPAEGWAPVFVPSIPSATAGQLYFVQEADVKQLDISLDDFRKTLTVGDRMSHEWTATLAPATSSTPAG